MLGISRNVIGSCFLRTLIRKILLEMIGLIGSTARLESGAISRFNLKWDWVTVPQDQKMRTWCSKKAFDDQCLTTAITDKWVGWQIEFSWENINLLQHHSLSWYQYRILENRNRRESFVFYVAIIRTASTPFYNWWKKEKMIFDSIS